MQHTLMSSVLVCMIMPAKSLECKYASVLLLLNRKSSSRMIESHWVLCTKRTLRTHNQADQSRGQYCTFSHSLSCFKCKNTKTIVHPIGMYVANALWTHPAPQGCLWRAADWLVDSKSKRKSIHFTPPRRHSCSGLRWEVHTGRQCQSRCSPDLPVLLIPAAPAPRNWPH